MSDSVGIESNVYDLLYQVNVGYHANFVISSKIINTITSNE